jgi:hypothetical protein
MREKNQKQRGHTNSSRLSFASSALTRGRKILAQKTARSAVMKKKREITRQYCRRGEPNSALIQRKAHRAFGNTTERTFLKGKHALLGQSMQKETEIKPSDASYDRLRGKDEGLASKVF